MFKVEGTTDKPMTVFSQYVDEDGDLILVANGINLCYIESETGKLVLFYIQNTNKNKLPGITFDEYDKIALGD